MKQRERSHFLTVGKIFVNAFLESDAESLPKLQIIFIIFAFLFQFFQQPADNSVADFGHQCVLLQHLAGNVKRQVGRVDDSLDKTQIRRHQLFYLVGNEHPVDVKFQPLFSVRLEQIVRLGNADAELTVSSPASPRLSTIG